MLTGISNSSLTYQTSQLEALHYAPKHTAFSHEGMQSRYDNIIHIPFRKTIRLWLAALHYNFNSDRKQATTSKGVQRYSVSFPKHKKGGYTVRKSKQKLLTVSCDYLITLN